MSRDKLLIVGVLVLGVMGFLVWKQAKKDQQLGTTTAITAASGDLPTISAPDDIDKISIKDGKKDEIVLVRTGAGEDGGAGTWELEKPVKAPASAQSVRDIVTNLGTLKVKEPVQMTIDDEAKKAKKLDADNAIVIKAWKGADIKTDLAFAGGGAGALGHLTLVASKPGQVYATTGFSSYLYTKEPKDFREKDIFKFDDANVSSIAMTNKNGEWSFTKGDKGWGASLKGHPIANLDEQKVKDMLVAFKSLNADDFGDGKSPADTGLDAPEATIKIQLKDNAGTYALKMGKAQTDGGASHYALKDGNSTVFVIGKAPSDWLLADASKFAKASDAGAPDAGGAKKTASATPPKK